MALQIEPYGSVPEDQVSEIEATLGQRLPEPYRTWIKLPAEAQFIRNHLFQTLQDQV